MDSRAQGENPECMWLFSATGLFLPSGSEKSLWFAKFRWSGSAYLLEVYLMTTLVASDTTCSKCTEVWVSLEWWCGACCCGPGAQPLRLCAGTYPSRRNSWGSRPPVRNSSPCGLASAPWGNRWRSSQCSQRGSDCDGHCGCSHSGPLVSSLPSLAPFRRAWLLRAQFLHCPGLRQTA